MMVAYDGDTSPQEESTSSAGGHAAEAAMTHRTTSGTRMPLSEHRNEVFRDYSHGITISVSTQYKL